MTFPNRLPDSLKKALPAGVSLFPRPEKKRWVMSIAPDWKQTTLPAEIVRPDAASAYVVAFLRERGVNPGAEMERRKVAGPTVGECADKWLALLDVDPRCAPATLKNNRTHVERWIKPAFGTTPIADLDVPMIRAWLRKLRAEKKGARTVLHVASSLRSLYGVAMAEGWVDAPANVMRHDGVIAEMPEPDDDAPIRLSLEAVQRLVDCAAVPLERRARYALAFTSGMRDGEIAGVRLPLDLDATPPVVKIEEAVALVGAKGAKGFAKLKAPKTKSSKRSLPAHAAAVAAIREWLAVGWPVLVGRAPRAGDFLFPRPDGGPSRPRSAEFIRDDLRAAGLPDTSDGAPVDFKAARSTFATWLDEAGVSEAVRKRLMGHRASDVTERHYTARELSALASAVATIGLVWNAGTVPFAVSPGTVTAESSMISAPPARVERTTFGLGNRCSIH